MEKLLMPSVLCGIILGSTTLVWANPGETLWTRTYGGSSGDEAYSVQQTTDGGYIIAGSTTSFGAEGTDFYLVKVEGDEMGLPDNEFPENTPAAVALCGNYPNPFNAQTIINYQLPAASDVKLDVFNLLSQKVATLVNCRVKAGQHNVSWEASQYSSGIYFYRLSAEEKVFTKRMTLLK